MIEYVDSECFFIIICCYLFIVELIHIDCLNVKLFSAKVDAGYFLIVLQNNYGAVGPYSTDIIWVFIYIQYTDYLWLLQKGESWICSTVELFLEFFAQHFGKAFCYLTPRIYYLIFDVISVCLGFLFIEFKLTFMNIKSGWFNSFYSGIVIV